MNKDKQLEQLLRDMGKENIKRPSDLVAKTINRMHSTPSPSKGGRHYMKTITKNMGIVVAASILLLVGLFTTWGTLSWLSNGTAGGSIDISQDERIIEVQQQVPFELALPTWVPQGYSLDEVKLDISDEFQVSLVFAGSGTAPLVITQSTQVEVFFRDIEFVQIGDWEDGYIIGSHHRGWGNGPRSDIGYYYESPHSDVFGHTLFFTHRSAIYGDPYERTFVSVVSESLESEGSTVPTREMLDIVKGITGVDKVEFVSEGENFKRWSLITPSYIPRGFKYSGMHLTAEFKGGVVTYSGELGYVTPGYDLIKVRQWDPRRPITVPESAEAIQLMDTVGYYHWIDSHTPALTFETTAFNVEVSTNNAELVNQGDLEAIANSITSQISKVYETPTEVISKYHVLPTTSNLIFSPDASMFVGYVEANNRIAQLWKDDTLYDLPGMETLSQYGPVSWRGERLVYHVVSDDDKSGLFYVYNTQDHNFVKIQSTLEWLNHPLQPVFINDETIAAIDTDGLWTYNLQDESWNLETHLDFQGGSSSLTRNGIQKLSWSPDGSKVAWIAHTESGAELTVFNEGEITLVHQGEEILDLAWSWDNKRLAAITGANTQGFIWDGEKKSSFDINYYLGNLAWVPGKEILAFTEYSGLALNHVQGIEVVHTNILAGDYANHAWLPNGNLAHVLDDGEERYEVTIFHWQ